MGAIIFRSFLNFKRYLLIMVEIKDESGDEQKETPSTEIELIASETLPEEVPQKIDITDHRSGFFLQSFKRIREV